MPKDTISKLLAVSKPADSKKQIIPWDYCNALKLRQKREDFDGRPQPDTFAAVDDILNAPREIIGRDKLV